ncbi:MAG: hypothetical protein Tp185DCM00d2C31949991_42 [Prokaryotic dsDNA virus sp.]|nr:MAG: hypothetical protein Tp162SUR1511541_18 [Prokaryotic dsDNA virus sp.]QDP56754.1 MAG: hypothetical protein Tp185DCM00d2C31949991_42 [Prokaryotic dsDNA virus sp.]QDP63797.1 MAG: hypothetical protein Unbinned2480contig1002_51 [Prokaryotic dsDNA virus sp.]QDP63858.1 MAG: hypothetical protein GOVbin2429_42 [Prokaryotic dsDNA virus sp.]|tara:strand:+ start:9197 stop:11662 length:2466 start_codon:yes stop_codon:yes gene_type:complete
MAKLIVQDQLKLRAPEVYPITDSMRVIDAVKLKFEKIDPSKVTIHLNDKLVPPYSPLMFELIGDKDSVTVTHEVKGVFSGFIGVAGDVLKGALDFLIDIPDFSTSEETSPNNNYSSQTNTARAYSQRPLVVGSPVIFPDLIGQAIEYYQSNVKQSEQYFEVCTGVLDSPTIQAGNTNIAKFGTAATALYYPSSGVTTIPDYRIGQKVDEVDGQIIKGTNEGQDGATFSCSEGPSASTYGGTTFTVKLAQDAQSDGLKASFDSGNENVELQYGVFITIEPGGGPEPTTTSGTGRISSMTLSGTEYTVNIVNFNGLKSETTYDDPFIFTMKLDNTIGPFSCPIECEKLFFNIKFDRGLKKSVPISVTTYELDSKGGTRTGVSQVFSVIYDDDTVDAVYETFTVTPTAGRTWYEFEVKRTNEASQDTEKPDIPTLEAVYCIQELGNYNFPDGGTMLSVKMPTTQIPTGSGVDNKINLINGQVMMPSYDKATQTILADAPSRNFADAALFVWRDFYGQDVSILNLDELYTIADSLPEDLKMFDYTFDDTSNGVGTVMDIILNVARVYKYWDGQQIRFWRDEAVAFNSALLSRADLAAESDRSYSISRSSFVSGEYDSVQIEYIDREINKKAYIYRSIDGTGTIQNVAGANAKQVVLSGCQNLVNATNRAELEIRKMLYQRWTLSDTFIDAHRFLERGAVVMYNEVYEGGDAWGGEILSVIGGTATVREELNLQGGTTYQVYYTNALGEVIGPQTVTASTANSFTCGDLSQVYLEGFEGGAIGSRYYITEVNGTINRRWRVMERETAGYDVQISMIGYDERIYEAD